VTVSGQVMPRHCERSEAIQRLGKKLDCFVAIAPRNDEVVLSENRLPLRIKSGASFLRIMF
jgi:hypothetical protein